MPETHFKNILSECNLKRGFVENNGHGANLQPDKETRTLRGRRLDYADVDGPNPRFAAKFWKKPKQQGRIGWK